MATVLYVVAMPTASAENAKGESLGGAGLEEERPHVQQYVNGRHESYDLTHMGPDFAFIEYTSIDDLVSQIDAALKPGVVLGTLEICAHGSPRSCGGIDRNNVDGSKADHSDGVGQKLMGLRWNDGGDLYLAGCNTGLTKTKDGITDSIAKRLAAAMKLDTAVVALNGAKFDHHLTVWGAAGFMQVFVGHGGTHLEKANKTLQTNPKDPTAVPYDGAKDATDEDCWIPNRNWP